MQVPGWEGIPLRRFAELNQVRVGVAGTVVVAVLLLTLLNIGSVTTALTGGSYSAAFSEAGQLRSGMSVRVSGMKVGKVTEVRLDGDHVRVEFTARDVHLGELSRAAIKTENALGRMFLDVVPAGEHDLEDEIPLSRTQAPYSLNDAVSDLVTTTGEIDTVQLARSFDTLADTFSSTPPELKAALTGVTRLSETLASRDQGLRDLLKKSNSVTGVLRERNSEIIQLLSDGNALLSMVEARRESIRALITNVTTASDALNEFAGDNKETLQPALSEMRKTLKILNGQLDNLRQVVALLGGYGRQLGESLGGGPWFYGYLQGLVPTNLVPVLPGLFGVGEEPNYGQPPPENRPPGGDEQKPTGDPYEPEPGQEEPPR